MNTFCVKGSNPIHCSHKMLLPSFSPGKIPLNYMYLKKCQITIFSGRLVKTPLLFLDFTMQVQLVKNTPQTRKMAEPIGGFWSSPPPLGLVLALTHCHLYYLTVTVCTAWVSGSHKHAWVLYLTKALHTGLPRACNSQRPMIWMVCLVYSNDLPTAKH